MSCPHGPQQCQPWQPASTPHPVILSRPQAAHLKRQDWNYPYHVWLSDCRPQTHLAAIPCSIHSATPRNHTQPWGWHRSLWKPWCPLECNLGKQQDAVGRAQMSEAQLHPLLAMGLKQGTQVLEFLISKMGIIICNSLGT